jgi:SAM-dependent methyltransferase
MARVSITDWLLERPLVYRLWQAPFEKAKLTPVLLNADLSSVRKVLDVGCGPGTNAKCFAHQEYLGIDLNPAYVRFARERFGRRFEIVDVTAVDDAWLADQGQFDFILVNSLMHHIDDRAGRRLLESLRSVTAAHGHLHLLELVRPASWNLSRVLAHADRGKFARSPSEWQRLWDGLFEPVVEKQFLLRACGLKLWSMIYLKGRPVP